ncbi:glycosyltransferase [Eggerthella timonensis]|uniref:glycosyltransferase n=1 Tax=Eggerthella timonensis TaxID=1871008 RepID=UPI0015E070D6|nr:glycosyltransferase [Eggerthella timonensis]
MTEGADVLVTAIVLHYENGDVIYETLDSILDQDYSRIELIVSDDCSEEFDSECILTYIEKRKRSNIERVVVRKNECNLGTVAHLEHVRAGAEGEIELLIAADDCWHDPSVFSSFVERFEELGPEAEFITSQIEMCDEHLQEVEKLFLSTSVQEMLKNGDMQSLLEAVSCNCVLAGPGSAFRRSYFEKLGKLSNQYTVVEDWSAHVRWLAMGGRIYYLDRITLKHRHGGISHSASSEWPQHYISYRDDLEKVFSAEIEPIKEMLSLKTYSRATLFHDRNQALCLSLRHRVSVLLVLDKRKESRRSVDSALRQNCLNYEMVIGYPYDLTEWVIDVVEKRFVSSPSIRRIRLVPYCENGFENCLTQLSQVAATEHRVTLMPGEEFAHSSSLLEFVVQEVGEASMSENEKPIVRRIEFSKKSSLPSRGTKLGTVAKRKASSFSQVSKIKEDLLYMALTVLGLCLIQSSELMFEWFYFSVFSIAFVTTFVVLVVRVAASSVKKLRNNC